MSIFCYVPRSSVTGRRWRLSWPRGRRGCAVDLGDMNGDLEVINRGGLPALRLLPGEHREGDYVFHSDVNETPVYVDTEEESTNDGDSPKAEIEEEDTLGYLSLE